jgi:hypothetical protein
MSSKLYLGDGVYVNYDGYHLILTVENGVAVTDKIFLDPEVILRLDLYRENLAREKRQGDLS